LEESFLVFELSPFFTIFSKQIWPDVLFGNFLKMNLIFHYFHAKMCQLVQLMKKYRILFRILNKKNLCLVEKISYWKIGWTDLSFLKCNKKEVCVLWVQTSFVLQDFRNTRFFKFEGSKLNFPYKMYHFFNFWDLQLEET
jgi:hypothetical protein